MDVKETAGLAILAAAHAIAAVVDAKKKEIPLWDFPLAASAWTIAAIAFGGTEWLWHAAGFAAAAAAFGAAAALGAIGGGDLIMLAVDGYVLGAERALEYLFFLGGAATAYAATTKFRKKETAFAPIALAAFAAYAIWRTTHGI